MKRSSRLVALVLVVLCLLTLGAAITDEQPSDTPILPLWEPNWSPLSYPTYDIVPIESVREMYALDLDADGSNELLVAAAIPRILLPSTDGLEQRFLRIRDDRFQSSDDPLSVRTVHCEDLDANGLRDLLVTTTDGKLWVFHQTEPWEFDWTDDYPKDLGMSSSRTVLCDLTGDGIRDLILCNARQFELFLLPGDADEAFSSDPVSLTEYRGVCWGLESGTYEGLEGVWFLTEHDLLFIIPDQEPIMVLENGGGKGLSIRDIDSDGHSEIVIARAREVAVYEFDGDLLKEVELLEIPELLVWHEIGDYNGDGHLDLAAGTYSPGKVLVYYRLHNGFAPPVVGLVSGGREITVLSAHSATIDLNRDGSDDIALCEGFGNLHLLSTQRGGQSIQPLPGNFVIGAADISADGYTDWLCGSASGRLDALIDNGDSLYLTQLFAESSDPGRLPYVACAGDVTGDGSPELIAFEFFEETYWDAQGNYQSSDARITAWDLKSTAVLFSHRVGADARPILLLHDSDGDGTDEIVSGRGDSILILDPTAGTDGSVTYEAGVIPWDAALVFLVEVRQPDGDVLAGYRVRDGVGEVAFIRDGEVSALQIDLPLVPFDLASADLDDDGWDELVTAGLGADLSEDDPEPTMMVAVVGVSDPEAIRASYYPVPGWPIDAFPVSYGGITSGDLDGDELVDIAIALTNGYGALVLYQQGIGQLGAPVYYPNCSVSRLFAEDIDHDGNAELVGGGMGIPPGLVLVDPLGSGSQ